MTYIHKIKLNIVDKQVLSMPYATGFIDIQVQNGEIIMWYYFDEKLSKSPFVKPEKWEVHFYGTGNPIDTLVRKRHLKTVQLNGFVWHIFLQN